MKEYLFYVQHKKHLAGTTMGNTSGSTKSKTFATGM